MDTGSAEGFFTATFDRSYAGKMKKGDTITFEGTIRDSGADNCKLLKSGGSSDGGGGTGGGKKGDVDSSSRLAKADFIKKLRKTCGYNNTGLTDGREDWSKELLKAVGPIPGRTKVESLHHESYMFESKQAFLAAMGNAESAKNYDVEVPFELIGKIVTSTLTYKCSDGRLLLEIHHSGHSAWYQVLRVRELKSRIE
jgi:hypothetical protein